MSTYIHGNDGLTHLIFWNGGSSFHLTPKYGKFLSGQVRSRSEGTTLLSLSRLFSTRARGSSSCLPIWEFPLKAPSRSGDAYSSPPRCSPGRAALAASHILHSVFSISPCRRRGHVGHARGRSVSQRGNQCRIQCINRGRYPTKLLGLLWFTG
jgi:hypothetical protein